MNSIRKSKLWDDFLHFYTRKFENCCSFHGSDRLESFYVEVISKTTNPFKHYGRNPWKGDRLIARSLPTQDITTQKNGDIHRCCERDMKFENQWRFSPVNWHFSDFINDGPYVHAPVTSRNEGDDDSQSPNSKQESSMSLSSPASKYRRFRCSFSCLSELVTFPIH